MSKLGACYDNVCTCCGKKFPVWYTFDTETKAVSLECSDNACECDSEYFPVAGSPSLEEWVEKVKDYKPFVVKFTVAYRNACLVYSRDKKIAEKDALNLYYDGCFDPEDDGYDGCDVDASPATAEQEEDYKYSAYLWDGAETEEKE